MNSNVQVGMVKKVYAPLSFSPIISFERLQLMEERGKFNSAWVVWYADTRLANPNKTRKQVVDMALFKFKNNIESMTKFIRSYSVFISQEAEIRRL